MSLKKISFLNSVQIKILIAIFLACTSIALSFKVADISFKDMQATVEKMGSPNKKLLIVNNLFINILKLNNLQKEIVLDEFLEKEDFRSNRERINISIDTLKKLYINDHIQLKKIESLSNMLSLGDSLLEDYIDVRRQINNNSKLFSKINYLSNLVIESVPQNKPLSQTFEYEPEEIEEGPLTDSKPIIQTEEQKDRRTLIDRIFKRKEKEVASVAIDLTEKDPQIINDKYFREQLIKKLEEREELEAQLISETQEKIKKEVQQVVTSIEQEQIKSTNLLLNKEIELTNNANQLLHQLLAILREIEEAELLRIEEENTSFMGIMNSGVERIMIIMYLFFLTAAIFVFVILSDISRSRKHKEELMKAKEEAEHHSIVKQRFLANISHEIRTPVQSILGFAEQVKNESHPNKDHLDAIYKSSEHLLNIVNEVLDYSKIISGKFTFDNKRFNLKKTVEEVAETFQFQADQKNIKIKIINDIGLHEHFLGDSFRLKQVLINLLGNAIKFTEDGQVGIKVSCLSHPHSHLAEFSFEVWDTGIGISPDEIHKIFQDFEQANSSISQKFGGTGLGLNIVKGIIEAQGGKINVESEVGRGTKFNFNLSFEKSYKKDALPEPSQENLNPKKLPKKTVIFDDDPFILQLCSSIFQKHSMGLIACSTPKEFTSGAWDDEIEFVLTDINIPGTSGFEICNKIKSITKGKCPVFAITAQALPEEHKKIMESGFDGILTKPFKENDLLQVLSTGKSSIEPNAAEPDLDQVLNQLKGNVQVFKKLLNIFVEDTAKDIYELKDFISKSESKNIAFKLHKLAGRTSQIGAKDLAIKLRELEENIEMGQFNEESIHLLEDLVVDLSHLVEFLTKKAEKIA
jgi:signal transduction histidine kinase/FixJ family two-component response regulator